MENTPHVKDSEVKDNLTNSKARNQYQQNTVFQQVGMSFEGLDQSLSFGSLGDLPHRPPPYFPYSSRGPRPWRDPDANPLYNSTRDHVRAQAAQQSVARIRAEARVHQALSYRTQDEETARMRQMEQMLGPQRVLNPPHRVAMDQHSAAALAANLSAVQQQNIQNDYLIMICMLQYNQMFNHQPTSSHEMLPSQFQHSHLMTPQQNATPLPRPNILRRSRLDQCETPSHARTKLLDEPATAQNLQSTLGPEISMETLQSPALPSVSNQSSNTLGPSQDTQLIPKIEEEETSRKRNRKQTFEADPMPKPPKLLANVPISGLRLPPSHSLFDGHFSHTEKKKVGRPRKDGHADECSSTGKPTHTESDVHSQQREMVQEAFEKQQKIDAELEAAFMALPPGLKESIRIQKKIEQKAAKVKKPRKSYTFKNRNAPLVTTSVPSISTDVPPSHSLFGGHFSHTEKKKVGRPRKDGHAHESSSTGKPIHTESDIHSQQREMAQLAFEKQQKIDAELKAAFEALPAGLKEAIRIQKKIEQEEAAREKHLRKSYTYKNRNVPSVRSISTVAAASWINRSRTLTLALPTEYQQATPSKAAAAIQLVSLATSAQPSIPPIVSNSNVSSTSTERLHEGPNVVNNLAITPKTIRGNPSPAKIPSVSKLPIADDVSPSFRRVPSSVKSENPPSAIKAQQASSSNSDLEKFENSDPVPKVDQPSTSKASNPATKSKSQKVPKVKESAIAKSTSKQKESVEIKTRKITRQSARQIEKAKLIKKQNLSMRAFSELTANIVLETEKSKEELEEIMLDCWGEKREEAKVRHEKIKLIDE